MASPSPTLYSIQYLRALAALGVVLVHDGFTNNYVGQQGVDIFFVISGFIMMNVSGREPDPLTFLKARAIRVAPLYWCATLAWAAIYGAGLLNVLLSLAFLPHTPPPGQTSPVLLPGWSLVYEAFFYLLFGVSLYFPARARLPSLTAALLALVVIGWLTHSRATAAQYYLNSILLEFLAGAWLHRAYSSGWLMSPRLSAIILSGGIIAVLPSLRHDPGDLRFILWGLPALVIVAGTVGLEKSLPRSKFFLLLGNASYAIYLTHYFIVQQIAHRMHLVSSYIELVAALCACSLLGVIVHLVFERPVASILGNRRALQKTRQMPALRPL